VGFSYKPLWHLLVQREMTKTEYRQAIGISTATLAKMGRNEYIAMDVLDKTCAFFKVPLSDVVEYVEDK